MTLLEGALGRFERPWEPRGGVALIPRPRAVRAEAPQAVRPAKYEPVEYVRSRRIARRIGRLAERDEDAEPRGGAEGGARSEGEVRGDGELRARLGR